MQQALLADCFMLDRPKRRFSSNEMHGIIFQKIQVFIQASSHNLKSVSI
jgi:predicted metal-binding protein